jgi:hypothetical protein
MRTDHLTFGRLWVLSSPANIIRVTRAYHARLRQEWTREFPDYEFSVHHAEGAFPDIKARYTRVIDFIRGPELARSVRFMAMYQDIPVLPGFLRRLRWLRYYTDAGRKSALALAKISVAFCEKCGVPAVIWDKGDSFFVMANTNDLGIAVLRYRPGMTVEALKALCLENGTSLDEAFWWLPTGDSAGWRINPTVQPVNTPDVAAYASTLLYQINA